MGKRVGSLISGSMEVGAFKSMAGSRSNHFCIISNNTTFCSLVSHSSAKQVLLPIAATRPSPTLKQEVIREEKRRERSGNTIREVVIREERDYKIR